MALQGTIDAFPLVDVVQLLGASGKTGRLTVDGDHGTRSIWVEEGALVAVDHPGTPSAEPAAALFELLRPASGSFVFDPGESPDGRRLDEQVPLGDLLEAAAELLEEWARIVAVVPSPAHRLVLEPEPGADEIRLDPRAWRVVARVGRSASVASLADELGWGELEVGRSLLGLLEAGLVRVDEPAEGDPGRPLVATTPEDGTEVGGGGDEVLDPVALVEPERSGDPFPDHFPIDDLVGGSGDAGDPWGSLEEPDDRFAAAQPFADPDAPVVLPPVGDAGWEDAARDEAGATGDGFAFAPAQFAGDGFDAPSFDGAFGDGDGGAGDGGFGGAAFADPAFAAPGTDGALHVGSVDALAPSAFAEPGPAAFGDEDAAPSAAPFEDPEPDSTDEILRQMSRLSPKAAEAIAAALGTAAEPGEDAGPTAAEA